MNPIFTYLIKSSFSIALLYCIFRFTMRNDKNHWLNRFLLLGILALSAIIPFLDIQLFYKEAVIQPLETVRQFVSTPVFLESPPIESTPEHVHTAESGTGFSINPWIMGYFLAIIFLLSRLLLGIIQIIGMIRKAKKLYHPANSTTRLKPIILAIVKELIQPFSFLNRIVLSDKDFTENKDIVIAHEHAHIKHLHAIDLMVCEFFTALHFFNPFMWMLRHDLKLIHEYQADQAVLNIGIDAKKYQLLVLQKSVGERRFAMANQFTQKPILKRLKMMQTKNRKHWAALKLILFVPMLIVLLQAFARPEILVEKANSVVPFVVQQDSSEVWLNNWTLDNLNSINGGIVVREYEIKPPPPNYPKTGLPKYDESKPGQPILSKNRYNILINKNSEILADGIKAEPKEVILGTENFLNGKHPFNSDKPGPQFIKQDLPIVGTVNTSLGVIIIWFDIVADKTIVNKLLRQIGEVHLKLREDKAKEKFQRDYFSLSAPQKDAIDKIVPIRVSIGEPKNVSQKPIEYKVEIYENRTTLYDPLTNSYKEISVGQIPDEIEELVRKVGDRDYIVTLYYAKEITKEKINNTKDALYFREIRNVKLTEIPPPPPPRVVEVVTIILSVDNPIDYEKIRRDAFASIQKNVSNSRITLKVEDGVSDEEINKVSAILKEAGFKKVNVEKIDGKKISQIAPPPPPFQITMKKDGSFWFGSYKYNSLSVFKSRCIDIGKRFYQQYDSSEKATPTISVKVEEGVSEEYLSQLKAILREANILNVNYSSKTSVQ